MAISNQSRLKQLHASQKPDSPSGRIQLNRRTILVCLTVWIVCFLGYVANGRYIGAGDCVPAMYLPISLARGDGPWLDRFRPILESPDGSVPGYCELSRGHIVSRYPVGPGLVLAPLVMPQVYFWDKWLPDWDLKNATFQPVARRMTKTAAAALAALSMTLLWLWLQSHFNHRLAWLLVIVAAFGTGMWSTASQAAWQHGPAVFCLMVSMIALEHLSEHVTGAVIAGFFAAMVVVCRTVDLPIAVALWLASLSLARRQRWAFAVAAAVVGSLWSGWNLYFFDHLTGGYSEIEKMHGWAHGVKGSWSTPFFTGLAGTLFSPSHGLIVYSPWVLFSAIGFGQIWRSKTHLEWRTVRCLSLSLPVTLVLYSKYGCWWAGHCFGARFWIDSTPVLIALAGVSLEATRLLREPYKQLAAGLFVLAACWSITLQLVAAVTYPTTWHSQPTNVDKDHDRLWDWHDNEVTRGIHDGAHARQWRGL